MISVIEPSMYVWFDSEGNITKITNYFSGDESYIKVDYSVVSKILDGTENINFYKVKINSDKKLALVKQEITESISYDINNSIYLIPKISKSDAILTVVQDIKNKQWIFTIEKTALENFFEQLSQLKTHIMFSIVDQHNPNRFYRIIDFEFNSLEAGRKEVPFVYDNESEDQISIYTKKVLESYAHEVINE
jgi:hypothetical protein